MAAGSEPEPRRAPKPVPPIFPGRPHQGPAVDPKDPFWEPVKPKTPDPKDPYEDPRRRK